MANLLIGNGINLLTNDDVLTWKQILQELSGEIGESLNMEGKSYLHIYEEVYSKAATKGKNEDVLRYKIVEQLSLIKQNDYHKQILNLPFKNIFTTNYDYGFTPHQQRKNKEPKYSLKRFQEVNGKKIWHIHGELNAPASIMLGYDHYMKSIGNLQKHLKKKKNELNKVNESWTDAFLNDDLYIFGLGLEFDEIDIWWLLAYRNRNILEGKIQQPSSFVYFDIINMDEMDDKTKNSINTPYCPQISMLKAYGVEIISYYVGKSLAHKSYSEAYDAIIMNLDKSPSEHI